MQWRGNTCEDRHYNLERICEDAKDTKVKVDELKVSWDDSTCKPIHKKNVIRKVTIVTKTTL